MEVKLPGEIWKKNIEWSFVVETNEKIKKVEVDPKYEYPDINGKNNIWISTEDQIIKTRNTKQLVKNLLMRYKPPTLGGFLLSAKKPAKLMGFETAF